MKVVHIATDDFGGAGKAASRISMALEDMGILSSLYVLKKNTVYSKLIVQSKRRKIKNSVFTRINNFIDSGINCNTVFHTDIFGMEVAKNIIEEADIVNLHWINEGIWSYRFLKYLYKCNKPIVWTMHDMWAFTGGCHYNGTCNNYKDECGYCHLFHNVRKNDMTRLVYKLKARMYREMKICFVGCSQWITYECIKSGIAGKKKVCNIPNPMPGHFFKVRDKNLCKTVLGINSNKKIILFGAVSSTSDKRKGFDLLKSAIGNLQREEYALGVFGNMFDDNILTGFETYSFGYIADDLHLALIYGIADVFVAPSQQENLANTVMEALSCGIPTVAYNIGGMSDMILDGINGYLCAPFSISELTDKMQSACELTDRNRIRDTIIERFSTYIVAEKYIDLYKDMIT